MPPARSADQPSLGDRSLLMSDSVLANLASSSAVELGLLRAEQLIGFQMTDIGDTLNLGRGASKLCQVAKPCKALSLLCEWQLRRVVPKKEITKGS